MRGCVRDNLQRPKPLLLKRMKLRLTHLCHFCVGRLPIIEVSLPDNKLKNALESRRESGEDVIWACKEIDRMEFEYKGIEVSRK